MKRSEHSGTIENSDQKAIVKAMKDSGKSYSEITKLLGIPRGTAHRWVTQIKSLQPLTNAFQDNRITLYRADQLFYRDHITKEKLQETSAKDLKWMEAKAQEMERLEAGKSTSNIGLAIYELIKEAKQIT